jgi:RNA polymerase sigma-70 factor (ECF subfamily)
MRYHSRESKFESMVKAYSADLYRFAYWLCRDRPLAEDLVQESFTRAWKSWDKLHDENAVKAWLFTILRREHARRYERKQLEIEEQGLDELMATGTGGIAQLEMREALFKLPPTYREPLVLQALGGFSGREIGAILEINEAAVMTRLTRARQALRKLIEPEEKLLRGRTL